MNCERFMTDPAGSSQTEAGRSHLRGCEECRRTAVETDSLLMFTALGREEVSAADEETLVGDVMSAINARTHERAIEANEEAPAWVGAMAAAAIVVAILSGLFLQEHLTDPANLATVESPAGIEEPVSTPAALPEVSRPVVEHYAAPSATIVELPSDDEIQLVMIFDETLPRDL